MSETNRLLAYMQPFWREIIDAVRLTDVETAELDVADDYANNVINNFYVATADRRLGRYEAVYQIKREADDTLQTRRERVLSKMRVGGVVTKETIRQIAAAFSNGDVIVEEYPAEYRVKVRFVSTIGVPSKVLDVQRVLRDALPAHLGLDLEFRYNSYKDVKTMYGTYGGVSATRINYFQLLIAEAEFPSYIDIKAELRLELSRYVNESKSIMLGTTYTGYSGLY